MAATRLSVLCALLGLWSCEAAFNVVSSTQFKGIKHLVAHKGVLLMAAGPSGIVSVDVSNPAEPTEKTRLPTQSKALRVATIGRRAYIADSEAGLALFDIKNPLEPNRIINVVGDREVARQVVCTKEFAFVFSHTKEASPKNRLAVIDVRDADSPQKVDHLLLRSDVTDAVLKGNYIFATMSDGYLAVFDIDEPTSVVYATTFLVASSGVFCLDTTAAGDYIFVCAGESISIFSYNTTGAKLKQVASINLKKGNVNAVKFGATYLEGTRIEVERFLICATDAGLSFVSVLNATNPTDLGSAKITDELNSIAVTGGHAYAISEKEGKLYAVNLNTPTPSSAPPPSPDTPKPTVNETSAPLPPPAVPEKATPSPGTLLLPVASLLDLTGGDVVSIVQVTKTTVYVMRGSAGVTILDVSDRLLPKVTSTIETKGEALSLFVNNTENVAFLADGTGGLVVYDILKPRDPKIITAIKGYDQKREGKPTYVSGNNGLLYIGLVSEDEGRQAEGTLYMVDVTDPKLPFEILKAKLGGVLLRVAFDTSQGMQMVTTRAHLLSCDLHKTPRGFMLGQDFGTWDNATSVVADLRKGRNVSYVAAHTEVRLFNNSNKYLLGELPRIDLGSRAIDVFSSNGWIFALTEKAFVALNVSNDMPFICGYRELTAPPSCAMVYGGTAYIGSGSSLFTVDLSETADQHNTLKIISVDPGLLQKKDVEQEDIDFSALRKKRATPAPPVSYEQVPGGISTNPRMRFEPAKAVDLPFLHAWFDVEEARYVSLPAYMQRAMIYRPPAVLPSGTQITVKCTIQPSCTTYIFVEHCLPCSAATNGGLPGLLQSQGWIPVHKGPTFKVAVYGKVHSTVVFMKQHKQDDDPERLVLLKEARFVGFGISKEYPFCADIEEKEKCNRAPMCAWDETYVSCVLRRAEEKGEFGRTARTYKDECRCAHPEHLLFSTES